MSKSTADNHSKQVLTHFTIRALAAHPYISAFLICILLHPFYLGSKDNVPPNAVLLEFLIVLVSGTAALFFLYKRKILDKKKFALFTALFLVLHFVGTIFYSRSQQKGIWIFTGGSIIILVLYNFFYSNKFRTQFNALLIFGISFLLKFYYVFYTSVYTRQNDVHTFGGENGHAGYIEYLLFNHHLPDSDVRDTWQFCHPPLHHIISAIWIYVNENIFGIGHDPARESLQTLTLFYSTAILITAYRILRHFKLDGIALYMSLGLIAFHPAFILLSGSINNDVLSIAFMTGAVLCTLRWYREPTLKEIIKIALCIGCGMMTKLSAAIVAPPIALVFLIVLIRKFKDKGLDLIKQFVIFGFICAPLGLWYQIRSYIKWKVPLTYVQEMDKNALQYLGDTDFSKRISDFSAFQFKNVFEQWKYVDENGAVCGYNEYNPLIALLKNSLFGEGINENNFVQASYVLKITPVFFWLAAVIAAISFIAMFFICFEKSAKVRTEKLFILAFYVTMMASFYKMAYDYPFTCTLNFRYITPTVICGALFYGLLAQKINSAPKQNKGLTIAVNVMIALDLLFALLSSVVYISACLPVIE